jgi:hypothetical protein
LQQRTAPGLLNCRAGSLAVARVEPTMHILAGLEGRDHLLGHRDPFPIARVAPGARVTPLDREHPKVTQFDPVTTRERGRAVVIVFRMALTMASTSRRYRCGFCSAILSISSDLSMQALGCS